MSPTRALLLLALPLAACAKPAATQQDLDGLDRELTEGAKPANQRDPALTAALRDQIMVDPAMTQSANTNVVRPPSRPDAGSVPPDDAGARPDDVRSADLKPTPPAKGDCPECRKATGALTLGELARRQSASMQDCAQAVTYSAGWANRLPAAVPLYPDARVVEAAGNDACNLRVVSFASSAPLGRLLDWYTARTTSAGFAPEHQADGSRHVLGGTHGDAAFVLYASPRPGGGTDVDLVTR